MKYKDSSLFKLLNTLAVFTLLLVIPIISLYVFKSINVYAMLAKVGLAHNVVINKILLFISIKQVVFFLFILVIVLVVFLAVSNIYLISNKQQVDYKNKKQNNDLFKQILKLENQDNKFGYMFSDAWGNPIAVGESFANILRLKSNFKENIFDLLAKNKDLNISTIQIEAMFKSLRSKYINQIDIPLKFSLKDSFYRLSIVPFYNNTCLWSIYFTKRPALLQSNLKYDDLIANNPVALMTFDEKGLLTYYNKAFQKALGVQEIDKSSFKLGNYIVKSQPLSSAIEDEESVKDFNSSVLVEKGLNGKVYIKKANGKESWYWLLQNISRDINGKVKLIRAALVPEPVIKSPLKNQSLDFLYGVFADVSAGFLLLDESATIVYANKYATSYYDIPKGSCLLDLFRLKRDDFFTKVDKKQLVEVKFDDYFFTLSMFKVQEYIGVVILDCTKSKMLEKELTESEGLQTVGQLASAVAHDFNNLLTAIMGFSDFIKSELTPDAPAYKEIEYIRQNSSRAMVMIRKLLTFSRNRELKPVYLDVNIAITEFNATIGRLIGENIQQQFKRGKNIGRILIDESQFQQVITNLVTNAKHAMTQKGGVLLISTYTKTFEKPVSLVKDVINSGSYIVVEVKDQGVGIKKRDLPKLFNSRFSTKGDQGNGFGLYNVYNIVRENAGYIDVKSELGVGTSFYIYLPHYDEKSIKEDKQIALDIEDIDLTGSGNILLVEDELPVRMVCVRVLKEKGYNIFEAEDGESAISILQQNKNIDLLISDVVMPGMDGIELVKNSRLINPALKVIMMSGYEEDVIDKKGSSGIEVEFISKPFTPQILATKVKNVLNNKKRYLNE